MDAKQIVAMSDLLRKGSSVANKAAWKSGQVTGTVLAGVVMAFVQLAPAFGISIPVDADVVNSVCATIVCVANVVLTWTTSEEAGILPPKE